MEQDKLLNQIKKTAENTEHTDFPAMDKVWMRVEDKLDHTMLQKQKSRWKKIAVGATVLLTVTTGYLFFKWNTPDSTEKETIVIKDSLIKTPLDKEATEINTLHPTTIKPEAEQLPEEKKIMETATVRGTNSPREAISTVTTTEASIIPENRIEMDNSGKLTKPNTDSKTIYVSPKQSTAAGSRKDPDFSNLPTKSVQQKENPLVVIDGKAVKSKTLSNMKDTDVESVVILDNPLYIINGSYYTEQQLFGPNPTSPYSPLDKQDIENLTVLQNEKATAIYGEKGKNGVVIITTKNGKPANLSEKKK